MPKPFITYDQQVSLMKSKHLIITDEDAAKRALAQIVYFSLIGGYKSPFQTIQAITMTVMYDCMAVILIWCMLFSTKQKADDDVNHR